MVLIYLRLTFAMVELINDLIEGKDIITILQGKH
jgi:hypothetical protein